MNAYKILTLRTLEAVLRGEASYWRLSDPLRWPGGIRGSLLAVMEPAYLEARLGQVRHWCPLDSGGLRLGFQQGPDGVAPDALLLGADSLAELLRRAEDPSVDRAVRAGRPLWSASTEPLAAAPVLEAFRARPTTQREWTYEVFLGPAAPPAPAEIAHVYCPNTAADRVAQLMEGLADDRIRTYNPRWTLDGLAAALDRDAAGEPARIRPGRVARASSGSMA